MRQYTTQWSNGGAVHSERPLLFVPDTEGQEVQLLCLFPQIKYQTFEGFGGAFTEAAGSVLEQMPLSVQREIIHAYYGPDGLGYTLGRTHIDSCDFSLGNYSANNDPDDVDLQHFDLSHDERYILPYIRMAAEAAGQDIPLLLAPWSPPPFMKTNGEKNHGGKLKPEYRQRWADYLCRYMEEYRSRGITLHSLSLQNEPKAVQTWDSCIYSPEEERDYIRDYLAPTMHAHGIELPLMIWDHNKERLLLWAQTILSDPKAAENVGYMGFHWYSGDHFEQLAMVRELYPQLKLILSECCIEYSRLDANAQLANAQMYAHDIIGNLNAGMCASVDWNLTLDISGGPNHVGNLCDAPIMCDVDAQSWTTKLSYDYIGHFSRYIRPGARRIGMSRYTDRLETTAFENENGELVVVVHNPTNMDIDYSLQLGCSICHCNAAKSSISTLVISTDERL